MDGKNSIAFSIYKSKQTIEYPNSILLSFIPTKYDLTKVLKKQLANMFLNSYMLKFYLEKNY